MTKISALTVPAEALEAVFETVNIVSTPTEVVSSTDNRVPIAGSNIGNVRLPVQSVVVLKTGVVVVNGPIVLALAVRQEIAVRARVSRDL